jgi:hypothetical protein
MKSLLLIGGVLGFGAGMALSFMQEDAWATCLWHGSVGAYVSAMLMRWWGQSLRRNLDEAILERESAPLPPLPTATPSKARS